MVDEVVLEWTEGCKHLEIRVLSMGSQTTVFSNKMPSKTMFYLPQDVYIYIYMYVCLYLYVYARICIPGSSYVVPFAQGIIIIGRTVYFWSDRLFLVGPIFEYAPK